MSKLRFTRRARKDLLDLWLYLESRASEAVADRILDRIETRCRDLAQHPLLGSARPEVAEGARVLVIERWLALYRIADNAVQIVRIVDGARDLAQVEWVPE